MDNAPSNKEDDVKWLAMAILRGLELTCSLIRKRYGIDKEPVRSSRART